MPDGALMHPRSGRPVEAFLFDLDGTLVDSAPDIATAINTVLLAKGYAPLDVPTVRSLIGEGIRRLTEKAFACHGQTVSGKELDRLTARFAEKYATCLADETRPLHGVVESLTRFKSAGFKMAVVSNKAQVLTEQLLSQIGLTQFFDHIQGAQAGLASKPAPDMILNTLTALGSSQHNSIFIGDSGIDIAAGNAAGIPVLLVEGGYAHGGAALEGAFRTFSDFPQLLRWVENSG